MGMDPVTVGLIATAVVGGASAYSGYRAERSAKLETKRQQRKVDQANKEATAKRASLIGTQRKQLGSNYSLNKTGSTGLLSGSTSSTGSNTETLG